MWNFLTQFYFRKVWVILESNYITKCQKVKKKKKDNFQLFKKGIKILTTEPFLLFS
jgi:glucose uptake protein GlcU